MTHENKVNENKVLSYFEASRYMWNNEEIIQKLFSIMSNLQTHYHFKLDFQKVDQHTEGAWLIHGIKHRNENQLQSLELPVE